MKRIITLSTVILATLCSCDDGSVTEKTYVDTEETYNVVIKGKLTGMDTWTSGYHVVVGGFNEESDYSLIQKSITLNDDEIDLSLTGIPTEVKTIEIAAVNSLRIRQASIFTYTIPDEQRTDEVMTIDLGTIDASMFTTIQKNLFENSSMNCSRCHRSSTGAGKLSLIEGESYAALVNIPSNHDPELIRVVPGDAENSLLYKSMNENMLTSMDHTGFFTDNANIRMLSMLKSWIDGGANE